MKAEKCTMSDIGLSIDGDGSESIITAVKSYLKAFAAPIENPDGGNSLFGSYLCLVCKKPLCGALGTFEFGFVNGEGRCSGCHWPVRMHHNPHDQKGNIFASSFRFPLAYHPDFVDIAPPVSPVETVEA